MEKFNLTKITLRNGSIVLFIIMSIIAGGLWSYLKLGRMESPEFTIRQMIVSVMWPGATADEMEKLVVDKIERKLQQTPQLDYISTHITPSRAVIYISLDDEYKKSDLRLIWQDVRNSVASIRHELPDGIIGPFFNDKFDDVFGSIYAVTGDGLNYEQMRQTAEFMRREFLKLKSVKRVDLIGVQKEAIYIEADRNKLANMGITLEQLQMALISHNYISSSGMVETNHDNVFIRIKGFFSDINDIGDIPLNVNGRIIRLAEIARIERRYEEPFTAKMYTNAKPAIGVAVSMAEGENVINMGNDLARIMQEISYNIPLGTEIIQSTHQLYSMKPP